MDKKDNEILDGDPSEDAPDEPTIKNKEYER